MNQSVHLWYCRLFVFLLCNIIWHKLIALISTVLSYCYSAKVQSFLVTGLYLNKHDTCQNKSVKVMHAERHEFTMFVLLWIKRLFIYVTNMQQSYITFFPPKNNNNNISWSQAITLNLPGAFRSTSAYLRVTDKGC